MQLPNVVALVETVLRPSLLLGVAGLLAVALRRAPARVRSAVWGAALVGSLLVPAGARWMPGWELRLPAGFAFLAPVESVQTEVEPVTPPPPVRRASRPDVDLPASPVVTARPTETRTGTDLVPAAVWLVWGLGIAVVLAWQAAGALRVRALISRAEPLGTPDWRRLLKHESAAVGLETPPRLLATSELGAPATWGMRRPVVLLPTDARCWIEERREVVLRHELVHVVRADWAVRTVARLACALYWFNPLAWWAWRRLNVEQELACDQEVVALGARASTYAGHLLGIARAARTAPAVAGAALEMARRSHLEDRIMAILDPRIRHRVSWALVVPALLVTAALVPVFAAVRPAVASPTGVSAVSPAREVEPEGRTAAAPAVPASPEMRRIVVEMRELEAQIEAEAAGIREAEEAMRPHLAEIEARAEKLGRERSADVEARLEPYLKRIREIEAEMEPIHVDIQAIQRSMEEMRLDAEVDTEPLAEDLEKLARELAGRGERVPADEVMERLHQVMESVHQRVDVRMREMQPQLERLEAMHQRLEPYHQRMEQIHAEMEPVLAEVERMHAEMEPELAGLDELQTALEPMQEKIDEVQRRLEPLTERMDALGDQLKDALRDTVRSALERDLGGVATSDAPFEEAADRLLERASIRLDDDAVELRISRREARRVLEDLIAPHRRAGVGEDEMRAAIETAADGLRSFEVTLD